MSQDTKPAQKRIDQFLNGPGGRADDWRDLIEAAKTWARGGDRANYDAALADLSVTEEFHGYPGLQLMAALREAAAAGDAGGRRRAGEARGDQASPRWCAALPAGRVHRRGRRRREPRG